MIPMYRTAVQYDGAHGQGTKLSCLISTFDQYLVRNSNRAVIYSNKTSLINPLATNATKMALVIKNEITFYVIMCY